MRARHGCAHQQVLTLPCLPPLHSLRHTKVGRGAQAASDPDGCCVNQPQIWGRLRIAFIRMQFGMSAPAEVTGTHTVAHCVPSTVPKEQCS